MAMTFNSLVSQVQSYLNRSDAGTLLQIPNFIEQATQRICRECKNIGFVVYAEGTFTVGVSLYPKPGRWRRGVSLYYAGGNGFTVSTPIQFRTVDFCNEYSPNVGETGAPKYYADYDYNSFIVAPAPDEAYAFKYGYIEKPVTITAAQQTNWITDFAPDVYLYATLLEAMPFLKDDERIPIWQQFYKAGIDSLNTQDNQRFEDRFSNRAAV